MTAKRLLLALVITGAAVSAHAQPATTPAAAAAEDKIERKDGHRVWKLTSYLQGTAAEIRQQLNGQVNHLVESRKKEKQRIADLATKIDQAREHGQNILLADDQHKRLEKAAKDLEAAKETARKSGTAQERLDAGAAYVKAKAAADQRRKQLVDDDANVVQLNKELVDAKKQLKEIEVSLGKAEAWRRELVDAVHTSLLFQYPLRKGMVGIIGPVTPKRAEGANAFEAEFRAAELVNAEGTKEGIQTVSSIMHPVVLLITGVEEKWEIGKRIALNRAFEVVGLAESPTARGAVHVRRAPDEVDELLAAVEAGPDVPVEEMDQMVRLGERKENPKKWASVTAMLTALPADLRPRAAGERLTPDKLRKADEWLGKELVGDTVDLSLTLQGIRLADAGVEVFATADAPNAARGRKHFFILVCPEAMRPKADKVRAGQPARVMGTIKSIHPNPDGTLEVRITDASF